MDRMPSQSGTWIGVAEATTLYTFDGKPHKVLQLSIQEGPKWVNGQSFVSPLIIVKGRHDWDHDLEYEYYQVNPELYEGKRLKIRGDIEQVAEVLDPNDKSRLIRTTPRIDYEHSGLGVIRVKRIEIIVSTNTPNSHQP
jgi:hypothetical protein